MSDSPNTQALSDEPVPCPKGPHVVIVDDDTVITRLISLQLAEHACTTVISEGFEHLREMVEWATVDAAVVDMHLGADELGTHLLAWLSANHPKVRRVLLTADLYAETEENYAQTVLLKPASVTAIRAAVGIE